MQKKLLSLVVISLLIPSLIWAENLTVTVSGSPHCNDGVDNDVDGLIDYPSDLGCNSISDENEIDPAPVCGDSSCNGSETCSSCSADCGVCASGGGGGGGGGGSSSASLNSVLFRGLAYPGSKVTILKDGILAASTQAGPDAKFEILVSDLPAKTYVFGVWAQDGQGKRSATYTFTVAVTQGITTSVSGIFVSPTISADKAEVKRGDIINIFGQGAPNSNINLIINSEKEIIKKTKTDTLGSWFYKFNSLEVEYGDHLAKSRVIYEDDISPDSPSVNFKVGTKNILVQADKIIYKGDMNKDGRVSLSDFSMLAYWYKRPSPKPEADLNSDGIVDLKDFSIIAFYWTG